MTKNPFINALLATAYIALVASLMFYGPKLANPKDTLLVPIGMISLLTFSVAVMGFLFFYQPLQIYFDGNKKGAVNFFFKTLATFGITTVLIFAILLSRIFG